MDEYGNVFLNFCVQRGLKELGAEAGRVWVPKQLPDPLQIPALMLQNNKFGTRFLKAFIYSFFPKRTCKHHLRKYSQIRKNQGQHTWQSTNRRESRRCNQVPGHTDSGGNAVLTAGRKALCAKRQAKSSGPPSPPAKFGNLMVRIYSPCPEKSKPPILGLKDRQSQNTVKHPDPADCHRSRGS